MADIIPRGADDLILDNMVTELQLFSAEQDAIDPGVGFNVQRDRLRPPAMGDLPLVVLWIMRTDPVDGGSSARGQCRELVQIAVDCYTRGLDDDNDGVDDSTAMERLAYLKEQVRHGLYKLANADFGTSTGTIGRKKWPRWEFFQTDMKMPEAEVVAGRWIVEIETQWVPEDVDDVPLEQITVNAQKWAATYYYGD